MFIDLIPKSKVEYVSSKLIEFGQTHKHILVFDDPLNF